MRLLAAHDGEQGSFFVNDMVLVERVWVQGRDYGFDTGDCLTAIRSLLGSEATATFDKAMRGLPRVRLL